MQATTCEHLPNLSQSEAMALFTYSFLLTPGQIQITSIENILFYISQHIHNTWEHISNQPPWTFDGVIALAILLLFVLNESSSAFYVNIAHTGLRLKK
jgi:hypothetical protein